MNVAIRTILTLVLTAATSSNALAEKTNPYANIPPGSVPPGSIPPNFIPGFDMQKLQKYADENQRKVKEKRAKRRAIAAAVYDEEMAKAKAEFEAGKLDRYSDIADSRARIRVRALKEQWKKEDAAERAPLEQQSEQTYRQFQQTGDQAEYSRQLFDMWKQMGIEVQPESR